MEFVFPPRCLVCRSFFLSSRDAHPRAFSAGDTGGCSPGPSGLSSFLCPDCLEAVSPVEDPVCTRCGKIFETREGEGHECEECIRSPKWFRKARAAGAYDEPLMHLIHQLKYRGKIQLAGPLGMLLRSSLERFWDVREIDIVVPVPLHKKRFRKRGFNQAYLLIKGWIKNGQRDFNENGAVRIDRDVLIREKSTKPQTGLSRKDRVKNIKNAFRVIHPEKIKKKRVLVVDDVYTTGATTNECARVLLKQGAESVDVLTLARAM